MLLYFQRSEDMSYHIRTSGLLTHLQGDQVQLLKTNTAINQQECPYEAEENKCSSDLQKWLAYCLKSKKFKWETVQW